MNGQSKNTRFRSNLAPQTPGLSYWESKGWFENTDALIVGGGLVGMNAALELQSLHPNWRIVLIDRSDIGGASTRNAGFACFGSPTELLEDWQILGREKTIDLVKMRWGGLTELRRQWGDDALGYRDCGSLEAFTNPESFKQCLAVLPEMNEALSPIFGETPFTTLDSSALADSGLNNVCGVISSPLEGDLDVAQMNRAMQRELFSRGIDVIGGVTVQRLRENGLAWRIETDQGDLEAKKVLVCNNAWASELLDIDVQPAPNAVVVSQPLHRLKLKQTIHHDRGYVYAREVDGRLLIGGGRHWDCRDDHDRIQRLLDWAQKHIVGAESIQIDHHWIGQLGVGTHRMPVIDELKPGLFAGVRLGGMGVAIGSEVGRQLARLTV